MSKTPVQRVQILGLLLLGVALVLASVLGDRAAVLGVALGGALASANFYALRRIVGELTRGGKPSRLLFLGTLLTLKFGLLAVLLYVVIRYLPVNPIGLLCGISVVVLAILVEGVRAAHCESAS